jgi:hypothetical protein
MEDAPLVAIFQEFRSIEADSNVLAGLVQHHDCWVCGKKKITQQHEQQQHYYYITTSMPFTS